MANEIKYKPQVWGEPIEGERLSTNGHYTGEQRGTTTQDALVEMPKYYVEETIIRRGTITQDVLNKIEQDSGSPYVMIKSFKIPTEDEYNEGIICYLEPGYFNIEWDCAFSGQYVTFSNDKSGTYYLVTAHDEGMGYTTYFDGEYCPQYGETVTVYKEPNAWFCGNCGSSNYDEHTGGCLDCCLAQCPECGEWYNAEMYCDNCGYGSPEE